MRARPRSARSTIRAATLHRFGLDPDVVEDGVQDVFIVAYRRRGTRRGHSTKAWLYGIARRVASNYRRSHRRRIARVEALTQAVGDRSSSATEAVFDLDRYLETLSAADRELFVLSELEGFSGPEIAGLLDRNVNTVYTRLRKLRSELPAGLVGLPKRDSHRAASLRGWAVLRPMLERAGVLGGTGLTAAGGGAWLGWVAGLTAAAALAGWSYSGASVGPSVRVASLAAASFPEAMPSPPPPAPAISGSTSGRCVVGVSKSHTASSTGAKRRTRAAAARPTGDASTLAAENALLERAHRALRAEDFAAALRLSDEHAAAFPSSVLSGVRATVRIRALCGQGKDPQARAEARLFAAKYPSMAALRRLEKKCEDAPQVLAVPDTSGS